MYHGEDAARRRAARFRGPVQPARERPSTSRSSVAPSSRALGHAPSAGIVEVARRGAASRESKSEARRLVEQGAVSVDGERVERGWTAPIDARARVRAARRARQMKRYPPRRAERLSAPRTRRPATHRRQARWPAMACATATRSGRGLDRRGARRLYCLCCREDALRNQKAV